MDKSTYDNLAAALRAALEQDGDDYSEVAECIRRTAVEAEAPYLVGEVAHRAVLEGDIKAQIFSRCGPFGALLNSSELPGRRDDDGMILLPKDEEHGSETVWLSLLGHGL